jgi:hypothetical protein
MLLVWVLCKCRAVQVAFLRTVQSHELQVAHAQPAVPMRPCEHQVSGQW